MQKADLLFPPLFGVDSNRKFLVYWMYWGDQKIVPFAVLSKIPATFWATFFTFPLAIFRQTDIMTLKSWISKSPIFYGR